MLNIGIIFFTVTLFFFDFNLIFASIFTDIPVNWQIGFQNPATPVMEGIIWLHNYILLFLIIVIVVVLWFLCRSLYLFNEYFNKVAMEFNHDPVIEAIWTIAPAFVLIAIAIPSFSLLYSMDEIIKPTLTVKIIGHQWYWSYELDSISRQDIFFDYAKRRINPAIDIFDLRRWEWVNILNYFEHRALKWEKFLDHLFVHKGVLKAMWTSNSRGISTGHLSFLVAASKMIWKNEVYRSLMPISPASRTGIIEPPIKLRTTFYSLLSPIAFSDSVLSAVKWLSSSVRFDSYMLPETDLPLGGLRLLEVDNRLVLPVKVHIRLLITSTDVIHSWAVPSFGVKVDAIPGRLNQASLYIKREGFFYGQCSELCGVNHGFMPIVVQSVDYNTFIHWIRINSNPSRLDALLTSNWKVVVEDIESNNAQRFAEK